MRVLVTGGAGFIGSNLSRELVYRGHEVCVVDNLYTGNKKFVPKNCIFHELDVRDTNKLDKVFNEFKPQIVFHLAAQAQVSVSMRNPKLDLMINLVGLVNVLDLSTKYKVTKLIMPSSAAVYGEVDSEIRYPILENTISGTIQSFYGLTKKTTEDYLRLYKDTYGLDYICFRYSNVYGPRQGDSSEAGVISIFLKKALSREVATIYGDGSQIRDYIYVDDVVEANIKAMTSNLSGVYNLSTGVGANLIELVRIINKNIELKVSYEESRVGDPKYSVLCNDKLAKELKFTPSTDLDEGVKSTLNYFKYN